MTRPVWEFVADHDARRRLHLWVRIVSLLVGVAAVAVGWRWFGPVGGFAGVAVLAVLAMVVQSWIRGDATAADVPVSIVAGDRSLTFSGADLYVRPPGDDAFELQDDTTIVPTDRLVEATVYPSVTDADGDRPRGFHLVVDLAFDDGTRWCAVFDRRLPFRIPGEVALVDAVAAELGAAWHAPPVDEPFGAVDERRLADWRSLTG